MANAVAGVGTIFQRYSGSAWVTMAEINSIEGPTMDMDVIDVTSLDTGGGYDEFITGFAQGGTLVLNMNFTRSTYEVMKGDFEIDVVRNYRIILPDDEATSLEFEGLVTEIPITMEAENQLTADVTVQISGEVSLNVVEGSDSSEDIPSYDVSSMDAPDELLDGHTVAWYDYTAESTITKDGSNLVSNWADKLGSGHDLIQATGSKQPLLQATGILFNGVDDCMQTQTFTWNQPYTVYIVLQQVSWEADQRILDGFTANGIRLFQRTGTPNVALYAGVGYLETSSEFPVGSFHILTCVGNGLNSRLQVDAVTEHVGSIGSTNPSGLTVGAVSAQNFYFSNIEVKEIICRDQEDNSTVRSVIYNYLKDKYSL